jgi:carbon storage regulator
VYGPAGHDFSQSGGSAAARPGIVAYNIGVQQPCLAERSAAIMLVLSRKLGEKICIGDNINITIVDIDRGKVRLGIEAPRSVPVYRQELLAAQPNTPPNSNVALSK